MRPHLLPQGSGTELLASLAQGTHCACVFCVGVAPGEVSFPWGVGWIWPNRRRGPACDASIVLEFSSIVAAGRS